jgi:hypothetical protein
MVNVGCTVCDSSGCKPCGGASSTCTKDYTPVYNQVLSNFQSSLRAATDRFHSAMAANLTKGISALDRVITDFMNADRIINDAMKTFDDAVGSEAGGIVGSYASNINDAVADISPSLKAGIGKCAPMPNESPAGLNDWISNQVTASITAAYDSLGTYITNNRTQFYDKVGIVAASAFTSRLGVFVDVYKTSLAAKYNTASADMDKELVLNVGIIKALDPNRPTLNDDILKCIDDFDVVLRAIINMFNASTTESADTLDSSIRGVKYAGDGANDKVDTAYEGISTFLDTVVRKVSDYYSKVMGKFNEGIAATSNVIYTNRLNSVLNLITPLVTTEFGVGRKQVISSYTKSSVAIRDAINTVKSFMSTVVPTSFFDTNLVRDFKRTARNDAIDLGTSIINSHSVEFNKAMKDAETEQVDSLNAIGSRYNDDVQGSYVTGASQKLSASFSGKFSDLIGTGRTSFNKTMQDSMNSIADDIYATRQAIIKYVDTTIAAFPVLRLSGNVDFPGIIVKNGDTPISFTVSNVGGSAWNGWFGIRAVDGDGNDYFHNVKPATAITIPAGTQKKIVLQVPFSTYFAGKSPRSLNIRLVSNTYRGTPDG